MTKEYDCINFYGEPSPLTLFSASRIGDIYALGGGIGLSAVFNELIDSPAALNNNLTVASANIANLIAARLILEPIFLRIIFGAEVLKEKCIITNPDENIPPSLDRYGRQALAMKNWYSVMGFGVPTLRAAISISTLAHSPQKAANLMFEGSTLIARMARGWKRFDNVAKSKWIIADPPPPETVKEKATHLFFALDKA